MHTTAITPSIGGDDRPADAPLSRVRDHCAGRARCTVNRDSLPSDAFRRLWLGRGANALHGSAPAHRPGWCSSTLQSSIGSGRATAKAITCSRQQIPCSSG